MRLLVLATSGFDGGPDARLMILRGADPESGRLWFHTDARAGKVEQLRADPAICLVAWDPSDHVQLRVRGRATVVASGELADRHWAQAALTAVYASPDAPGRPLRPPDPRLHGMAHNPDAPASGRDNFAVIEVAVDSIEWLQVDGAEQRRATLYATDGWRCQPLVP